MTKRCTRCGEVKANSEFSAGWVKCLPCRNDIHKARYRDDPEYRSRHTLLLIKQRAKRQGLPFNLTAEDTVFPEICPVLGLRLEVCGPRTHQPSVDKIVPELGYVKGNVIVVSMLANMIKSCATLDQIQAVADFYRNLSTIGNIPAENP